MRKKASCKHEDLKLNPQNPQTSMSMWACSPIVVGQKQVDSTDSLARQPSQNSEFLLQWEILSQGNKSVIEEDHESPSNLDMCTYLHTSMHYTHCRAHIHRERKETGGRKFKDKKIKESFIAKQLNQKSLAKITAQQTLDYCHAHWSLRFVYQIICYLFFRIIMKVKENKTNSYYFMIVS